MHFRDAYRNDRAPGLFERFLHRLDAVLMRRHAGQQGVGPVRCRSRNLLRQLCGEFIEGIAEFDKGGVKAERKATITAYRFQGRWFFTPPGYDDRWKTEKITEAELNEDFSRFLKVEIAPDCPLELVRLSVRMDPKSRSLRQLSFDLRNNSKKEVDRIAFSLVHISGKGSVFTSTPFEMRPGEIVSSHENTWYVGYVYYCEGESEKRFTIDRVTFKDGSLWSPKRSRTRKR